MTIYLDESGNTGPDLLNLDQPFYILVSLSEEAFVLYDRLRTQFPINGELHYVELKRQYNPLLIARLIADYFLKNKHARAFLINKRYMLIGKILDYLVEPQLYSSGIDYYADSTARSHADLIYYFFTNFMSEDDRVMLGKSFISMVKKPCTATIDGFYLNLEYLCHRGEFSLPNEECTALFRSRKFIEKELQKNPLTRDPLDPCIPAFFELVADWIKLKQEHAFTYDRSTPISRSVSTIKAIFEDHEKDSIGFGRGKYALTSSEIRFIQGDSRSYPLLQVADILSGVLYDLCMQRVKFEDEETAGTASLLFNNVMIGSILPSSPGTQYPTESPNPSMVSNTDLFTVRLLEKMPVPAFKRRTHP